MVRVGADPGADAGDDDGTTDDDTTTRDDLEGGDGDDGSNNDGNNWISGWGDLSKPDWLQNLETFAANPQRAVLGVFVSSLVAYAVWISELTVAGILAAAGFEVGIPGPDGDVPGAGDAEWLIAPRDWFGPVDVPGRVLDILGNVGSQVGAPIVSFVGTINSQMASAAGTATSVPGIVQPFVVLLLWALEFAVVIWIVIKAAGLGKQLALDTINPL